MQPNQSDVLPLYEIFHNPVDHPGRYVGRRQEIHSGGAIVHTCEYQVSDDLKTVREWVGFHSCLFGRQCDMRVPRLNEDPPNLVETWV